MTTTREFRFLGLGFRVSTFISGSSEASKEDASTELPLRRF